MNARAWRACRPALFMTLVAAALAAPGSAQATDPSPWTRLLVPAPLGWTPTTSTLCQDGSITCVDQTIAQQQAQLDPLLAACDHNATFNLVYLRTTQAYRQAAATPGYFRNTPYVNQFDTVFGSYYRNQYNAWRNGHPEKVAPAWRMAFAAADNKTVSALGDVFLALNAHILTDEPSVLDEMGLVYEDGVSGKGDYDKSNEWLSASQSATINEVARRLDPTVTQPVALTDPPFSNLTYQLVALWREEAWRFAEQLKLAEALNSSLLYRAVRAAIDAQGVANANAILLATHSTAQQTATRDAYCQAHHNDP